MDNSKAITHLQKDKILNSILTKYQFYSPKVFTFLLPASISGKV
ncbi:MAG TPA: hypothetical protein VLH94_03255 [Spirochaetia bacterium]|nr:hypothetical protein [Spirochaetia bacterium]